MSGWARLLQAAAEPLKAFEHALLNPERAQRELLMRLIRSNEKCEFGRSHGFADMSTLEAYRAAVPVRSYSGFEMQISRLASGETAVLTSNPVVAFEETGGTSSGVKLIPYTQDSLTAFRAAALPWLADLARRRPGVCAGKSYVSVSPATRAPRTTDCGISVGLPSEAAYLGDNLSSAFLSILAVPPEVAAICDVSDWRLATLAALLSCEDLSFVSVWSPTFLLQLVEAITACQTRLFARLSRPARHRLDSFLQGGGSNTSILWPRLDTVSCWSDGSSAGFASRLSALCPQAFFEPKGLFATEAAVTLPWGGKDGCVPALTSTFTEFIDGNGVPHLAHQLDKGASYRVVITTPGGLYRYDMGDRVRCVGHEGDVGRLVFEGRAGMVSDLVGEKLDEAFVAHALAVVPFPAALSPKVLPTPHYELWLDATAGELSIAHQVEAALWRNPQYAYARKMGQLGPLTLLLRPGFVTDRHKAKVTAGKRLGDLKHTSLIMD